MLSVRGLQSCRSLVLLCHTIVRLIYHKSSLRITLLCLSLVIAKWGEQWDRKFITHDFINRSFLIDQRNFILETFIVRGVLIDQRNFILEVFIVRGVLIGRQNFIWKNNFVRSEGLRCCTWLERERHVVCKRRAGERLRAAMRLENRTHRNSYHWNLNTRLVLICSLTSIL